MPYTAPITVTPFDPRLSVNGMPTAPYTVPGLPVPPAASVAPVVPTTPAMPVAAVPRAPAVAGAPGYGDLRDQIAKMYTGLLNQQNAGYTADPLATGLLNMGAALSQYGAPSTTPKGGFMGAIGAGGQGFIGGYQAAADARRKAEMALLGNKLAAAKALMDAQKDRYVKLGKGDRLVDMSTNQMVAGTSPPAFDTANLGITLTPTEKAAIEAADDPAGMARDVYNKKIELQTKFRDEFRKQTDGRAKIIDAALRAQEIDIAGGRSGVGQLETLYTFITSLDPESVVREGEIGLATQVSSLMEQARLKVDKVRQGALVPEEVAQELRQRIMELGERASQGVEKVREYYGTEADIYGLRRSSVLPPVATFTRQKRPVPSANTLNFR